MNKKTASLKPTQETAMLKKLTGWNIEKKKTHALVKQYTFKNFVEAMEFVDEVALLAEDAKHHPDITISYNKVTLVLTTHDANGLTKKDFDLAGALESSS